jgi:hypothetical protein
LASQLELDARNVISRHNRLNDGLPAERFAFLYTDKFDFVRIFGGAAGQRDQQGQHQPNTHTYGEGAAQLL